MKRKSIVVLLVLLLVGILAFTAFACNNDKNKKPNNPNTGTPGGDDPNPGGDDNTEDTNAINEAIPALLGGLDQVAAKVGDVSDGAYLKANIALGLSLDEEIDLDLKLSLAASMDKTTSAKNWALIGLGTSEKDIVNLYIKGTAKGEEIIYLGEILTTGETAWHKVSVLDVKDHASLDGIFLSKSENDNNSGLIERVFNFLGNWENDEEQKLLGPIDFSSDSPISDLSFKLNENSTLVLGQLLTNPIVGGVIPSVLSAKATENGYSASLVLDNLGDLIPVISMFAKDLDLDSLSPFTELLLGLKIKDGAVTPVDEDDATPPSLNINFDLAENGDLSMLEIAFANDNVAGHNVALNLKIDGIEAEAASKAAEDPAGITTSTENLGLHLSLNATTPAIGGNVQDQDADATIDLYVNPDIKIGFAKDGDAKGYIQFDLSGLEAYATFTAANGKPSLIAEYVDGTGVLVNLAPVFAYAGVNEGQDATYLISGTEDVEGWLNDLITNPAGNKPAGDNKGTEEAEGTISNASLAGPIDDIIKLITDYTAATNKNILGLISGILAPALTDSDSVVGGLLAIIGDANSGLDIDKDAEDNEVGVEINFKKLIETLCAANGLIGSMEYEFELYDTANPSAAKAGVTLKQILEGDDILDYLVDFIYTAKYDAYCEGLAEGTAEPGFAAWYGAVEGKVTKDDIIKYANDLGIDLSGNDLAAKLGTLVATVTMGADGDFKVALSLAGASLSLSADFDAYAEPSEALGTLVKEDGQYTTSGNNAELVAALAQLGYAYMPSFAPEAAA